MSIANGVIPMPHYKDIPYYLNGGYILVRDFSTNRLRLKHPTEPTIELAWEQFDEVENRLELVENLSWAKTYRLKSGEEKAAEGDSAAGED